MEFEKKKKIVEEGKSTVFENWSKNAKISKKEFLEELEWLCADPKNERGQLTRELGCTPTGMVRLKRIYSKTGSFLGFYRLDNDFIFESHVSISAWNRI